jgi:N6-adenosine-specific RNA methylase IME4
VQEFKEHKRKKLWPVTIEGQAALEGMFRVLYADPPWQYSDSGVPDSGALGKASRHYSTMTLPELCKLPVQAHAMPHSVLFLWVPAPMLPEAFPVIDAWGFTYKTGMVWDKVLGNWGHYVRVHHEHLLIATRGSCMPDVPTPMPDSVQVIRRGDVHSAKPEEFRRIITKLYTRGPYLELFGRKRVEGWAVFGNDARLWAKDMERTA